MDSGTNLSKLPHSSYKLLKLNKHAVKRGQYCASRVEEVVISGRTKQPHGSRDVEALEEIVRGDSESATPLSIFTAQLVVKPSQLRHQTMI